MAEGTPKKSSGSRSSCILITVVLIVLVILGIPMLLTMMLTHPPHPEIAEDRSLRNRVRDGIESYYRDHGRLPAADTFDGLAQLLLKAEGPSAPYLNLTENDPAKRTLDRRGKTFFYAYDRKGRGYVIGSHISDFADVVKPLGSIGLGLETRSFKFSPDGSRLAVLFSPGRYQDAIPRAGRCRQLIVVVDVESGEPVSHVLSSGWGFFSYGFLEDSKRLVTTDAAPVTIWDAENGKQLEQPLAAWWSRRLTTTGSYISGQVTVEWKDGIDVAESEKQMKELAAKRLLPLPPYLLFDSGGVDCRVVTKDFSRLIAVGYAEHGVWNAQTGERLRHVRGSGGTSVAASADGKQFAIGGRQGQIDLYDVETGAKQASFSLGEIYVGSIAFSPDGALLAAGCSSAVERNLVPKPKRGTGQVRVLDLSTGEQRASLKTGIRDLPHVAFSPDGKLLVAEDGFASLGFWNTETWEKVKSIVPWPEALCIGTYADTSGSPSYGVPIVWLVIAAMGCLAIAVAFRHWLRERRSAP